jgi:hypothetical protein
MATFAFFEISFCVGAIIYVMRASLSAWQGNKVYEETRRLLREHRDTPEDGAELQRRFSRAAWLLEPRSVDVVVAFAFGVLAAIVAWTNS